MHANTPNFPNVVGSPCPADIAFKELLTYLIRRSHKTRKDIAKEMSTLTAMRISKRMIDDWTCPSKPARFPAFLVAIFSEVIADESLQRHLMSERLSGVARWAKRFSTREISGKPSRPHSPSDGRDTFA